VDLDSDLLFKSKTRTKKIIDLSHDNHNINAWAKKSSVATSTHDINPGTTNNRYDNDYGMESVMQKRLNNAKLNNTAIGYRNIYGMSSSEDEDEDNLARESILMKKLYNEEEE